MPQSLFQHTFPNGLTLVAERMDHVRSARVYTMLPSGFLYEPADRLGLTGVFAEMLARGAGERDSRELANAFDNLGADCSEDAGAFNVTLSAGTLARNLYPVLELQADIIRRPWLDEEELEPARELSLQDLQALDDSPPDLCLLELNRRYYPDPYSRSQHGTVEGLNAIESDDVKKFHAARFRPKGAIISVAGKIDWAELMDSIGSLYGDWTGSASDLAVGPNPPASASHVTKDSNQTQIGIAFPTAPLNHPDFYRARAVVNLLSGGMSARLFTEVREKRGLCYSVSASYDLSRDRAAIITYAGTETNRAQQTLDVTLDVLKNVGKGIAEDELDCVKAGLKTGLIMATESTASRAGAMASEWFHLGRLRPIEEIQSAIDGLTTEAIEEFVERFPAKDFTVVTLGREPLTVPG